MTAQPQTQTRYIDKRLVTPADTRVPHCTSTLCDVWVVRSAAPAPRARRKLNTVRKTGVGAHHKATPVSPLAEDLLLVGTIPFAAISGLLFVTISPLTMPVMVAVYAGLVMKFVRPTSHPRRKLVHVIEDTLFGVKSVKISAAQIRRDNT